MQNHENDLKTKKNTAYCLIGCRINWIYLLDFFKLILCQDLFLWRFPLWRLVFSTWGITLIKETFFEVFWSFYCSGYLNGFFIGIDIHHLNVNLNEFSLMLYLYFCGQANIGITDHHFMIIIHWKGTVRK